MTNAVRDDFVFFIRLHLNAWMVHSICTPHLCIAPKGSRRSRVIMFCLLVGLERVSRRKDEQRFPSSLYGLERTLRMESHVFAEGSRVRVITYSPFRGLKGTIRIVHRIAPRVEEPF